MGELLEGIFLKGDANDLASLVDNLPGMIYRCEGDFARGVDYVSAGCLAISGYSARELLDQGESIQALIHPADRAKRRTELELAEARQKQYNLTYRMLTRQGAIKWVRERGHFVSREPGRVLHAEGVITDISDQHKSEELIQRQIERFDALRKIDMAITASMDQRVTFEILLYQVTHHLEVDAADILVYNPSTRLLEYAAGRGFRTHALQYSRLRLGDGFAGQAALERHTVQVHNLRDDPGGLGQAPDFAAEGFETCFCVPLIAKGQVKGILEIFHRGPIHADGDWLDFLNALAGQAAVAIDNITLFEELQRSLSELSLAYDATLEGWSKALELRSEETHGHTQRVTELTMKLVEAIGFQDVDPIQIRHGALMHDIGKMGIPDRILLKPGPLDEEEWGEMRRHPVYAYRWLSGVAHLRPALDIPYCHHEHWDGSGYPRGLIGEEIPLPARIFAVADVWDALLHARPYRDAWSEDRAYAYIRDQRGKLFDPKVVDVFLKMVL